MEIMDLSGVFFIASIASILGALFSFFAIPETRNKSISQLENLFQPQQTDKLKLPSES